MQVIVGIGAKPVVGPFEAVGVNREVGGIEVCFHAKIDENYLMLTVLQVHHDSCSKFLWNFFFSLPEILLGLM